MKTRTLLLSALLAASALLALPSAQALQGPVVCVTEPCSPFPSPGPIDVDTRDYYACAPPSGFVVERQVGNVHVAILVCDGGVGDRLPDLTTSSAAMQPPIYCVMAPCPGPAPPPAINWCTAEAATPAPASTLLWGTDAGCDIDVDTTDYYACAPPSGFIVDRTVGPVHLVLLVCDGGVGDRLGDLVQPWS